MNSNNIIRNDIEEDLFVFPGIRLITTNDYIDEINKSIDNHNYLSALVLSLMVPDICSGYVDFVNSNSKTTKYEKWFNKYVYRQYYDFPSKQYLKSRNINSELYKIKFNGSACYALRCAILHSGNTEIYQSNKSKEKRLMINVDNIQLCVNGLSDRDKQFGEGVSIYKNADNKTVSIKINIVVFANRMIEGYKVFLKDNNIKNIKLFNMIDNDVKGERIVFSPYDIS